MSDIAQLRWRCRRGMKELDIALQAYMEKQFEQATTIEQEAFRSLLDMQDRELFELVVGHNKADDEVAAAVITKIRSSFMNKK